MTNNRNKPGAEYLFPGNEDDETNLKRLGNLFENVGKTVGISVMILSEICDYPKPAHPTTARRYIHFAISMYRNVKAAPKFDSDKIHALMIKIMYAYQKETPELVDSYWEEASNKRKLDELSVEERDQLKETIAAYLICRPELADYLKKEKIAAPLPKQVVPYSKAGQTLFVPQPPAALLPTPKQSSPLLPSPRVTSPVASALRPIPGQQPSALLPTPPAV
ncbi:MAG TPA: hypothetical protein VLJ15_00005, partial [Gammaproteobacteria bacterium]|nr:hypothetical protein [Gammaproteobacteria bacterium]